MTQLATSGTAPKQSVIAIRHKPSDISMIEDVAAATALMLASDQQPFAQAFALASGISKLRQVITNDMMQDIMQLQNTSLGFRTDKPGQGYDVQSVKECFIEAVLRGAKPIGNEFNIISGRTYLTKEYFQRMLTEIPGITNLQIIAGLPQSRGEKEAAIRMTISWKLNGQDGQIVDHEKKPGRVFSIRVNSGMGADAVVGKATRKACKAAFEQITGTAALPDGDVADEPSRTTALPGPQNETSAAAMNRRAAEMREKQMGGGASQPNPQITPPGQQGTETGNDQGAQAGAMTDVDHEVPPIGALEGDPGYVAPGGEGADTGKFELPPGEEPETGAGADQSGGANAEPTGPKTFPTEMPADADKAWFVDVVATKFNIDAETAGRWLNLKLSKPWEKLSPESRQFYFKKLASGEMKYA